MSSDNDENNSKIKYKKIDLNDAINNTDTETWVFEQVLNDNELSMEEYWKHAFTNNLETLQYIEKGTGSFTEIKNKQIESKMNPTYVYREVNVQPHQRFLNYVSSYLGDDADDELIYKTIQNKFVNYRMTFINIFNDNITQYIPMFKGEIKLVKDNNSTNSFKQIVTIYVKVNIGKKDSNWKIINWVGTMADNSVKLILKKSIENELQEMLSIAPKCIEKINRN